MDQPGSAAAPRSVGDAEVADGIYRLGDRYVDWYVLDDRGRLTVVDAGLPGHWEQFPTLLRRMGRAIADVEVVLLTHDHRDHLGNAERLRRMATAAVWIHGADREAAKRGGDNPPLAGLLRAVGRPPFLRYMAHVSRAGALRVPPVAELATFSDGELLDVPGHPRVIHTPGHTRGSCVLLVEERGVLFSGDALVTLDPGRGFVGPTLLRPPFVLDLAEARASLRSIEALDARVLLPGHGAPWHDGAAEAVRLARHD